MEVVELPGTLELSEEPEDLEASEVCADPELPDVVPAALALLVELETPVGPEADTAPVPPDEELVTDDELCSPDEAGVPLVLTAPLPDRTVELHPPGSVVDPDNTPPGPTVTLLPGAPCNGAGLVPPVLPATVPGSQGLVRQSLLVVESPCPAEPERALEETEGDEPVVDTAQGSPVAAAAALDAAPKAGAARRDSAMLPPTRTARGENERLIILTPAPGAAAVNRDSVAGRTRVYSTTLHQCGPCLLLTAKKKLRQQVSPD